MGFYFFRFFWIFARFRASRTDLKPTKIEDGLPVMGCPDCEGASLSLLYYRDWAERNAPVEQSEAVDTVPAVPATPHVGMYLVPGQDSQHLFG